MNMKAAESIVFLHGFMGCGEDWDFYREKFSGDYNCITPNLHAVEKQLSISGICDNLHAHLSGEDVKNPVFVGYSMGGRIALNYVCRYSVEVSRLVLISTNPGIEDETARRDRIRSDEALAEKMKIGNFIDFLINWYNNPIFAGMKDDLKREIISRKAHNNPAILAESLRIAGTGRMESLWTSLPQIEIPVLVVAGSRDEKYLKISTNISRLIKNCRLAIIPDASHCVYLEQRKVLFQIINNFIRSREI